MIMIMMIVVVIICGYYVIYYWLASLCYNNGGVIQLFEHIEGLISCCRRHRCQTDRHYSQTIVNP